MRKCSSNTKDIQQLARSVLDAILPDAEPKPEKNRAAVALGGMKGGKARANNLGEACVDYRDRVLRNLNCNHVRMR